MNQPVNYTGKLTWAPIFNNEATYTFGILAFYLLIIHNLGVDALMGATVFYFISATIVLIFIKRFGLLSWRAGIPIFYLLYFIILPVLLEGLPNNHWLVGDEAIDNAFLVATLGLLAFAGSVMLGATRKPPDTRLLDWLQFSNYKVILVLFVLGVTASILKVNFGFYMGDVQDNEASAVLSAGPLGFLVGFVNATMLAVWSNYFKSRQTAILWLAMLMLIIAVLITIPSTSKGAMLYPIFYVGILQFSMTKKLPIKSVVVVVLAYFLLVYPIVSAYRSSGLVDRARSGSEMLLDYVDFIAAGSWLELQSDVNAKKHLDRGLLLYLSLIIEDSGTKVPYLNGESYMEAASIFVPRLLWSTKSSMNLGNVYARRYGVIGEYDLRTNVSPTYMGEQYMNFGLLGVLIGMAVMGRLAIWVDRWLLSDPGHWYLPAIVTGIGWQESYVGHTIGPFIKSTLAFMVIIYIANRLLGPTRRGNQGVAAG